MSSLKHIYDDVTTRQQERDAAIQQQKQQLDTLHTQLSLHNYEGDKRLAAVEASLSELVQATTGNGARVISTQGRAFSLKRPRALTSADDVDQLYAASALPHKRSKISGITAASSAASESSSNSGAGSDLDGVDDHAGYGEPAVWNDNFDANDDVTREGGGRPGSASASSSIVTIRALVAQAASTAWKAAISAARQKFKLYDTFANLKDRMKRGTLWILL